MFFVPISILLCEGVHVHRYAFMNVHVVCVSVNVARGCTFVTITGLKVPRYTPATFIVLQLHLLFFSYIYCPSSTHNTTIYTQVHNTTIYTQVHTLPSIHKYTQHCHLYTSKHTAIYIQVHTTLPSIHRYAQYYHLCTI